MNYFKKVVEKYEKLITICKQDLKKLEEDLCIAQAENQVLNILVDKGYGVDIAEIQKLVMDIRKQISTLKNNIDFYEEIISIANIESHKEEDQNS